MKPSVAGNEMRCSYRYGLTLSAAFVSFAYMSLTIVPLAPYPILLGWALDALSLGLVLALSELVRRHRSRAASVIAALLFYALFYVIVVSVLSHTFFFESAAERRFSLLEIDLKMVRYFFTSVLPLRGVLLLSGLLAAIHLLALAIVRFARPPKAWRSGLALGALWVVLGVLLARSPRVPSPLADIGAGVWEQLTTPEIVIDRSQPVRYSTALLDKSESKLPDAPLGFDKVLVFVMETMTYDTVERESKALPESTFVRATREHRKMYTRYYATNQDSRTGMLSMLGSRFIPHEAYTEQGRDQYMYLGERSSLVDTFAARGYKTAFAVSQQELEIVVSDLKWDEVIHLEEGDTQKLADKYLCFVPYEFEHSCEDRALLPRVFEFIDKNERAFLYQEFIWGHAAEYNKASGKTNTEYYSAYLDSIVQHLVQTGQLERTLIVLTSDHGFRDKGLQSDRRVYQLPLWFFSPRFSAETDQGLFSHLDFKDLLFHQLVASSAAPKRSPFVMIIGPTGTSFLSVLTDAGQFLLMKARANEHFLVHAEGLAGPAQEARSASEFLRLYEDYLAHFTDNGTRAGR
jgi:hypothetical protein